MLIFIFTLLGGTLIEELDQSPDCESGWEQLETTSTVVCVYPKLEDPQYLFLDLLSLEAESSDPPPDGPIQIKYLPGLGWEVRFSLAE